jgi:cephalosporin-C deacetylase-like acetyl esterase
MCVAGVGAAPPASPVAASNATERGDRMIAAYFEAETKRLEDACLADVKTLLDWNAGRAARRAELLEMLGLDPLPEKTDLKATVTGKFEPEGQRFTVENLHFQSRPGLYVTGNFYVPKGLTKPAPAVLYVCGHGGVTKNGIIYGNKVHYHHHGAWFARNGYACLIIDSLQLGEIEGVHHGTHNKGMWWWNSRGYTPAGVEAWNCVRAVDYLQSRTDVVDPERIGVTGRSGGGAYSWWIGAIDDRIKVAAPVAGITDLHNHVVGGAVEGHCDCMFMVNTYRWDYPMVAALLAPRPLLIANTDKDVIFPLDGVMRTYWKVRRVYDLHREPAKLGPAIIEGPHFDAPELQLACFRWFNRHLAGHDPPIADAATKLFEPEPLKVFKELPSDSINAKVHEVFVPAAPPPAVPDSAEAWAKQRDGWMTALREKCFRAWPAEGQAPALELAEVFSTEQQGVALKTYDFTSQDNVRLRLYVAHRAALRENPDLVVLNAMDDAGWAEFQSWVRPAFEAQFKDEPNPPAADAGAFEENRRTLESNAWAFAYVAPRGVGPTAFNPDERKQTHIRRRFMLLGQTLESAQAWDVRRAAQAVRSLPQIGAAPLWMQGERQMAGITLYASLFEPDVARLDLWDLPKTHMEGPHFLNVLRFLDVPAAVTMAAERSKVRIYQDGSEGWTFAQEATKKQGWPEGRIELRAAPDSAAPPAGK